MTRFTAPPTVAGSGQISKMRTRGTLPSGANFVNAKAVVNPAIPPPGMRMSTPSGEAGAMVVAWRDGKMLASQGGRIVKDEDIQWRHKNALGPRKTYALSMSISRDNGYVQ